MGLFRSSIFVAFVSLFILTGYGLDVLDYCCENDGREEVSHKDQLNKGNPVKKGECQCICHQTFIGRFSEPVRSVPFALRAIEYLDPADEIAPDAMPLGIEYPPQLS